MKDRHTRTGTVDFERLGVKGGDVLPLLIAWRWFPKTLPISPDVSPFGTPSRTGSYGHSRLTKAITGRSPNRTRNQRIPSKRSFQVRQKRHDSSFVLEWGCGRIQIFRFLPSTGTPKPLRVRPSFPLSRVDEKEKRSLEPLKNPQPKE